MQVTNRRVNQLAGVSRSSTTHVSNTALLFIYCLHKILTLTKLDKTVRRNITFNSWILIWCDKSWYEARRCDTARNRCTKKIPIRYCDLYITKHIFFTYVNVWLRPMAMTTYIHLCNLSLKLKFEVNVNLSFMPYVYNI